MKGNTRILDAVSMLSFNGDHCLRINLPVILEDMGVCGSRTQALRLIQQGAVEINGIKIYERHIRIADNSVLKCGKKFWRRVRVPHMRLEVYEEDECVIEKS